MTQATFGCFLALAMMSGGVWAQGRAVQGVPVLTMDGTMWRYFETWQTEVVRLDSGELVRVDPLRPRSRVGGPARDKDEEKGDARQKYELLATKTVRGSAFPPAGWQRPDFDDSGWLRRNGMTRTQYRGIAMECLRGKFHVSETAPAQDMSLSIAFHGGVVVYLNGQEVARADLPKGQIAADTLAEGYPKECFLGPGGGMLLHVSESCNIMSDTDLGRLKDTEAASRLKKRTRRLDVVLPARMLCKGVNVLAVEAHRAPAIPEMFMNFREVRGGQLESSLRASRWWNRVSVDEIRLEAPAGAAWVTPNCSRPRGVQVWNQDVMNDVHFMHYGDPNESVVPIRICGVRNGTCSGEFVLSSTEPITGVKVVASELKAQGRGVIPASAVRIRYWRKAWQGWVYYPPGNWVHFDALDAAPSADGPLNMRDAPMTLKPVWVTVDVPRDAAAGDYAGTVTVQAKELSRSVEVPVQLHVCDWTLPDSKGFKTYLAMPQSPDTLSLEYNVPMWSEEHWKLIERSFQLMAQLGAKDVYIPVVRRSHLGNEHGMVRWVPQAHGGTKCDFSIVERYLDTAMRHLGKLPVVCCLVLETGPFHAQGLAYTEMDPDTKALKEATGPKWGAPESVTLLRPFFSGMCEVLAKRGLEKSLMVGMHIFGGAAGPRGSDQAYETVKTAGGDDTRFFRVSHYWFGDHEFGPGRPKWGCVCLVSGVIGVFWDPDTDKPIYGWHNPELMLAYPRTTNLDYAGTRLGQESFLPPYRLCAEAVLTAGRRKPIVSWGRGNISGEVGYDKYQGVRGFGPLCADFWPVLKGAKSTKSIVGRYGDGYSDGGWGTVSLNQVVPSMLCPGKDGPLATARFEMMREALQEAEARILVQDAILNEASRTKLGPELARKCKELCDDRTRALRYVSEFWSIIMVQDGDARPDMIFPRQWEDRSRALYDLAAEVSKAIKK